MTTLFIMLLLALLTWFWFENLGHREIAIRICKHACQQVHVQLLDDTVVLERIRLKRNQSGHIAIQRNYRFEFTDDGNIRQQGNLLLFGNRLELIDMQNYGIEVTSDV